MTHWLTHWPRSGIELPGQLKNCVVFHTFYPNLPIFLHKYICHICAISQLWANYLGNWAYVQSRGCCKSKILFGICQLNKLVGFSRWWPSSLTRLCFQVFIEVQEAVFLDFEGVSLLWTIFIWLKRRQPGYLVFKSIKLHLVIFRCNSIF